MLVWVCLCIHFPLPSCDHCKLSEMSGPLKAMTGLIWFPSDTTCSLVLDPWQLLWYENPHPWHQTLTLVLSIQTGGHLGNFLGLGYPVISHLALKAPKNRLGHQTKFYQLQTHFLTISGLGFLSHTWAFNLCPLLHGSFGGPWWIQLSQSPRQGSKGCFLIICFKLR